MKRPFYVKVEVFFQMLVDKMGSGVRTGFIFSLFVNMVRLLVFLLSARML